jgi:hypothetical protein
MNFRELLEQERTRIKAEVIGDKERHQAMSVWAEENKQLFLDELDKVFPIPAYLSTVGESDYIIKIDHKIKPQGSVETIEGTIGTSNGVTSTIYLSEDVFLQASVRDLIHLAVHEVWGTTKLKYSRYVPSFTEGGYSSENYTTTRIHRNQFPFL